MKILFTTDTIRRGGKERQIFVMSYYLLNTGFDVYILCQKKDRRNYIDEYSFPEENLFIIGKDSPSRDYKKYNKLCTLVKPDLIFHGIYKRQFSVCYIASFTRAFSLTAAFNMAYVCSSMIKFCDQLFPGFRDMLSPIHAQV